MREGMISLIVPCHNSGKQALRAVQAIGELDRPRDCELEAIVVDDASSDDSATLLRTDLPAWARVVHTPDNLGRGAAINLGVAAAHGDRLLFLDCDCLPSTPNFLFSHWKMLDTPADVSIGDIHGVDTGFWGRYQSAAALRRVRIGETVEAFTTANIMMRLAAFNDIGGFDTRYRRYGFEDRDLLLRLRDKGSRLYHNPDAPVVHAAHLDLSTICHKMRECGACTAPLFRAKHPDAYSKLGYAAADAQLHPWLHVIGRILGPLVFTSTNKIERWLQQEFWPYPLRAAVARSAIAIAYLDGTRTVAD